VAETKKASKDTEKAKKKGAKQEEQKQARAAAKRAEKAAAKAHTRDSLQALSKLGERVDGRYQIVSQPPLVVPVREAVAIYGQDLVTRYNLTADEIMPAVQANSAPTGPTSSPTGGCCWSASRSWTWLARWWRRQRRTRCWIVLLQGRDADDPLFLQVKEATDSVLERYLPKSRYRNHGERVVHGQRLVQATSDIFLGWTKGHDVKRHYYWRQLRDMKGSAEIEAMAPLALSFYAGICGWTLARAHARSGDPVAIAEYLGAGDAFDNAITDFSERYADQNEQDHQEFVTAIRPGRLEAVEGLLPAR